MKVLLLMLLGFGFWACGDDKEEKKEDSYVSCSLVPAAETAFCIDYKNATGVESGCTQLEGTYAAAACTVTAGLKGCRKTNANGVETTTWYTGSSYTGDSPAISVESLCNEEGDTVVTKE